MAAGKPNLEGPGWWWYLDKRVPDEEGSQKPLTSADLPGLVVLEWQAGLGMGLLDTKLELHMERKPPQVLSQRGGRKAGIYQHALKMVSTGFSGQSRVVSEGGRGGYLVGGPDVCLPVLVVLHSIMDSTSHV